MNKHKFASNLSRLTMKIHFPANAFKLKASDALKIWSALSYLSWLNRLKSTVASVGLCVPSLKLEKAKKVQPLWLVHRVRYHFILTYRYVWPSLTLKATPPNFLPQTFRTQLAIVTWLTNGRETNGGVYSQRRIQWSHMASSALYRDWSKVMNAAVLLHWGETKWPDKSPRFPSPLWRYWILCQDVDAPRPSATQEHFIAHSFSTGWGRPVHSHPEKFIVMPPEQVHGWVPEKGLKSPIWSHISVKIAYDMWLLFVIY